MLDAYSKFDSLVPTFGSMRRDLERAFNEAGLNGRTNYAGFCPLSMWHDEQHQYIAADVPGLSHDDIDVQFEDGKLWIRGERHYDDKQQCDHNERQFGKFERAVLLSDIVDPSSIDAALEDGVLTITLTKKLEAQPRSIEIRKAGAVKKLADESSTD